MDLLSPTIFHEEWWLSIACEGRHEAAEVTDGGRVVGRWPYIVYRRLGMPTVNMPPLTHFLGPAIDPGAGSPATRYLKSVEIGIELARRLPRVKSFRQTMHGGMADVVALQMASFETGVQFTYELAPLAEPALWRGMRDKTRNVIRKAMAAETPTAVDAEEFARFYFACLDAMRRRPEFPRNVFERLVAACLARGAGKVYALKDSTGHLTAALFCVWDRRSTYYLMSARDPRSGSNGSVSLLLWTAIKDAACRGLVFDFDGIAYRGSVLFYAGFGAVSRPRYIVSQSTLAYRALREVRRLVRFRDNPFT